MRSFRNGHNASNKPKSLILFASILVNLCLTCYLLQIGLFEPWFATVDDDNNKHHRRSMLISGAEPISPIPTGTVLPGVSYFNKIYNMLDGTDLLEKSGRDMYTFRYSNIIQTWTSPYTYVVPVEFTGIPNIYPQCTKDTTLSAMKETWSSSIITEVSSSKSSGFAITLEQIGAILAPIVNAISPGVGTSISSITSSSAFKDVSASIQKGNSRNTRDARTKHGEGFERTYTLSAESSLYEATIAWDQYVDFDAKTDFKSAINKLELSATNSEILQFIASWGTHVIHSARMGAVCEESAYLKSLKQGSGYIDFYTYTKTRKSSFLFWSSSSSTTTSTSASGVYNDELFYEFASIRCEGECATSQSCGDMTGSGFHVKPVEYELKPIWAVPGLMSSVLSEKFQLLVAHIVKALLECRVNTCDNHGICTLRDDVFTTQFVMSWDGVSFDDMVDYNRACYCDDGYGGSTCASSGHVAMECDTDPTYVTSFDIEWRYLRSDNRFPGFLSGVGSSYSSSHKDRMFKWKSCTPVLNNNEKVQLSELAQMPDGYTTGRGATWTVECPANNAIISMSSRQSIVSNTALGVSIAWAMLLSTKDRVYSFLCAGMKGVKIMDTDCYWTDANTWHNTFWRECTNNGVITGVWSQYDGRQDRLYKYKCCRFVYDV